MFKKKCLIFFVIFIAFSFFESCSNTFSDSTTVYITKYGSCYHKRRCSSIKRSKNVYSISKSDAISRGYKQCSKCKP